MELDDYLGQHPDTEVLELVVTDLNGHPRGKWLPRESMAKALDGGAKLPLTTLALDVWGRDPEAYVFDSGDSDGVLVPELRTLVPVPWASRPTAQVLASLVSNQADGVVLDPRRLLQQQVDALAALGLRAVMAFEMEFHLFQANVDSSGKPMHSQLDGMGNQAPGGQTYSLDVMAGQGEVLHAMRDACISQGLPVDTLITEGGVSQFEVNLYHQQDALLAADQAVMLRRAIKGTAAAHNLMASFMAKPQSDQPGNGMHLHMSLVDHNGNNVFAGADAEGSPLLRQAIAGLAETLPDVMLLLAPHMNSWRRFQRGSHAPMSASWGYDNRTVALRVPAGPLAATRIEHRMAGADANPYLVAAALLAGMRHGLVNQLQAAAPVAGNAYEQDNAGAGIALPGSWQAALASFAGSDWLGTALGTGFQRAWAMTKTQEQDTFAAEITPLEYASYLGI